MTAHRHPRTNGAGLSAALLITLWIALATTSLPSTQRVTSVADPAPAATPAPGFP